MNKSLVFVLAALVAAPSAFAGGTRTATLDVANMDCAVCPITVRKALEKVPGWAPRRSISRRIAPWWRSTRRRRRRSC